MPSNNLTPALGVEAIHDPAPGSSLQPIVINATATATEQKPNLADVVTRWQVVLSAIVALLVLGGAAAFFYLSFATDDELNAAKQDVVHSIGDLTTAVNAHNAWANDQRKEVDQSIDALRREQAADIKEINAALKQIATDVAKMQGTLEALKKH